MAVAPPGAAAGTEGDIYIANNQQVNGLRVVSPSGTIIGGFTENEACGVATDTNGSVYAGFYPTTIRKYTPTANPPGNGDLAATSTASLEEICNIAVDSSGAVYAANYSGEHGISRLADIGASSATPVDATAISMAIAPGSDNLLALSSGALREYDPAGNLLSVSGTAQLSGAQGVAVDGASAEVYVGNEADHQVDIFGPSEVKVPGPKIVSSSLVEANAEDATVEAVINPEGEPSTLQIEYGPTTSYGSTTPVRQVGEDERLHRPSVVLSGLTPGSTYHWRVVAIGSIRVEGPDRSFRTSPRRSVTEGACPNAPLRFGAAERLLDCRAYEMVSPVDKNNADIKWLINIASNPARLDQSALSGDRLTYSTSQGFADAVGVPYVSQYLADRTSTGWANRSITPTQGLTGLEIGYRIDLEFRLFDPQLCSAVLLHYTDPALAVGAVEGWQNLYKRQLCDGNGIEALSIVEPPEGSRIESYTPNVMGLSDDGACVVFQVRGGFAEGINIYENCNGSVTPINIEPDGEPTSQAAVGTAAGDGAPRTGTVQNAVSANGSLVYWTEAQTGEGTLMLRRNAGMPQSEVVAGECTELGKACTVPVSGTVGPGAAHFWTASENGQTAVFSLGNALYEYDAASETSRKIAGGFVAFMGASGDAKRLYFISEEQLAGPNNVGAEPTAGGPNLYLFDSEASPAAFEFVGEL